MKDQIANLFRATPVFMVLGSLLVSGVLTMESSLANPAARTALLCAIWGIIGDVTAAALKRYVFLPLYTWSGSDMWPIIGLVRRPPGAKNCGAWPYAWGAGNSKSDKEQTVFSGLGMPSGHSVHMFTVFSFLLGIITKSPHPVGSAWWGTLILLGVVSTSVAISRVVLGCHTWQQVLMGSTLGGIGGWMASDVSSKIIWHS